LGDFAIFCHPLKNIFGEQIANKSPIPRKKSKNFPLSGLPSLRISNSLAAAISIAFLVR